MIPSGQDREEAEGKDPETEKTPPPTKPSEASTKRPGPKSRTEKQGKTKPAPLKLLTPAETSDSGKTESKNKATKGQAVKGRKRGGSEADKVREIIVMIL